MAKKSTIAKARKAKKYKVKFQARCRVCGRPRAVFRKFELCRLCFREFALKGEIPGITKASW